MKTGERSYKVIISNLRRQNGKSLFYARGNIANNNNFPKFLLWGTVRECCHESFMRRFFMNIGESLGFIKIVKLLGKNLPGHRCS